MGITEKIMDFQALKCKDNVLKQQQFVLLYII